MKIKLHLQAAAISLLLFIGSLLMFNYGAEMDGIVLTTLALYSHMLGSLFAVVLGSDINTTNWFLFLLGHTLQYVILYFLFSFLLTNRRGSRY